MNFKSLDFSSLKSLIMHRSSSGSSSSNNCGNKNKDQNFRKTIHDNTGSVWEAPPHLRIETIEEPDELLLERDHESRRSTITLGNNSRQSQTSLLHAVNASPSKTTSSPSPYLSIVSSPNLRRSSTSDIIKPEPAAGGSGSGSGGGGGGQGTPVAQSGHSNSPSPHQNRRTSANSLLLRKARERREVTGASQGIGARSISSMATPTAGRAARSAALGQRRKSMAAF